MRARVGDRVSYEDAANPKRTGTVTKDHGGHYTVVWDESDQWPVDPYDPEARYTECVSDLRQPGWRREA